MEYTSRHEGVGDAIDWFARELQRSPDAERHLKAALRQRIGLRSVDATPRRPLPVDEAEDLWDNVPI